MPTLTVKNVPDELYERLKESAEQHEWSIDDEVIFHLKRALFAKLIDPEAFLAKVEAMQKKMSLPPLTDEFLRAAKEEGCR
jgi:antitoxin FitA